MTVNVTALSASSAIQVSDRRVVALHGRKVVYRNDNANKAVVMACADAKLSIAFAGFGLLRGKRVDRWLAETMLERGACELKAKDVVEILRDAATDWFRSVSFPVDEPWAHTFSVAAVSPELRPRHWAVIASSSGSLTSTPTSVLTRAETSIHDVTFAIRLVSSTLGVYCAGLATSPALEQRRRTLAEAMRHAGTYDNAVNNLLSFVRELAGDKEFAWGVSKDALSVVLRDDGTVWVTSHPANEDGRSVGPYILWYEGGYNLMIEPPTALLGSGYAVIFGPNSAKLTLISKGPRLVLPGGPSFSVTAEHGRKKPLRIGNVQFSLHARPAVTRVDDEKSKSIEYVGVEKLD